MVQRLTGVCPTVAIHVPWDRVDDWDALARTAAGHGVAIGAVNPNLFQEDDYRLGSLCHPDAAVRRRAVEHVLDCVGIARAVRSSIVSLWLADGTNYPGQDDLIVGSTNPFELFLVFNELVSAEDDTDPEVAGCARRVAYMIDQSHNIEPKLEAMVQSVVNVQVAHAKALLVDRARLREAQ